LPIVVRELKSIPPRGTDEQQRAGESERDPDHRRRAGPFPTEQHGKRVRQHRDRHEHDRRVRRRRTIEPARKQSWLIDTPSRL
jgi:hypothetical protein